MQNDMGNRPAMRNTLTLFAENPPKARKIEEKPLKYAGRETRDLVNWHLQNQSMPINIANL